MLLRFFIAFGGLTETGLKKNAAECQDVMRGSKCRGINMIFISRVITDQRELMGNQNMLSELKIT